MDNTKEEANRIKKDQIESEKREQQIKIERDNYLDLATRITLLFFILVDFSRINIMYQFSLLWFKSKFEIAIEVATPEEEQPKRIEDIWKNFLGSIYEDVCRGLFECDRILFSFCIATRLEINYGRLDIVKFKYLIQGHQDMSEQKTTVAGPDWVNKITWNQMFRSIVGLKFIQGFEEF